MLIVKSIIQIAAIVGLILALGDILGWYKDKDRVAFLKIISKERECSPDQRGAQKFLKSFFYPLANKEELSKPIDKIKFVGLFTKGGSIDTAVSGSIIIKNIYGEKTGELCSYSELLSWSKEAPLWKWIGWVILAASVISGLVIFVLEIKLKG